MGGGCIGRGGVRSAARPMASIKTEGLFGQSSRLEA